MSDFDWWQMDSESDQRLFFSFFYPSHSCIWCGTPPCPSWATTTTSSSLLTCWTSPWASRRCAPSSPPSHTTANRWGRGGWMQVFLRAAGVTAESVVRGRAPWFPDFHNSYHVSAPLMAFWVIPVTRLFLLTVKLCLEEINFVSFCATRDNHDLLSVIFCFEQIIYRVPTGPWTPWKFIKEKTQDLHIF